MNIVILSGNLGSDPEIQTSGSGVVYGTFPLYTHRQWKSKGGERHKESTRHRVVAFKGLAKSLEHLSKGSRVLVRGRIQNDRYEDDDGIVRYGAQIVAEEVTFL